MNIMFDFISIGLVDLPGARRKRQIQSKIEKVPRGIRGGKSSKDMASLRNLVSTIAAQASPTCSVGDGTRCPDGKAFPAGMPHPLQMLHGNHS